MKSPTSLLSIGLLAAALALAVVAGILDNHAFSATLAVVAAVVGASSGWVLAQRSSAQKQSPEDIQRTDFEAWQQQRAAELQQEADRVLERQQDVAAQAASLQELLEFPVSDIEEFPRIERDTELSDKDREVNELLEAEAGRVYEAIRNDEYRIDGQVNLERIRNDVLDLVQRIARVYSPNSANPLLETSFEKLARAASRICLHTLVLLEQLPLDVKSYTINQLHTYLRQAVKSYGAYNKIAPWVKAATRTAYVGRFAAGANPVALGAWWLATEVTRRGATKLIENVVDRQAVGVLHDVVAVVGVEVANIYGPGYRQRDAAWIFGTELTELLSHFPTSRESLKAALREISALPLASEYDRVYLYRCVAENKSAGQLIADPTVLPRDVRVSLAERLEAFRDQFVHGLTDEQATEWRSALEARFDLKLKPAAVSAKADQQVDVKLIVQSVCSFVTGMGSATLEDAKNAIGGSSLMTRLDVGQRAETLDQLQSAAEIRFEPPDLDPASELTDEFLKALFDCSLQCGILSDEVLALLNETAGYFRRTPTEAEQLLRATYVNALQPRIKDGVKCDRLPTPVLKAVWRALGEAGRLAAEFDDVSRVDGKDQTELADHRLIVVEQSDSKKFHLLSPSGNVVWASNEQTQAERVKGYLIDDCRLSHGDWTADQKGGLLLSGSMLAGGYSKMFAELLNS